MSRICSSIAALVFVCICNAAMADIRALLVGVSDYDDDTGIPDLRGPANDVNLLSDVLQMRGATDILILTDGIDGSRRPTLASIEDGFAEISSRAMPGDLVYVHLSGHGTRQHDLEGDETDGLDEVFLPANVARAENGGTVVPNALTDDRINELVMAIRRKGADVWLVMDSCHSGSGARSIAGATAERQVDPAVLGLDLRSTSSAERAVAPKALPPSGGLGGFLAFYATRSNDVAREGDFSESGGDGQWFGLFSSALAARLQASQALSYRQLFQAVLSDMNRRNGFGAGGIQTPLWEGDLIDAPVFGGGGTTGIERYLVEGDRVDAGLVHGLQVGTLLALVEDIGDGSGDVLGYAQIEEVEARKAYLRPVSDACHPGSGTLCDFAGQLPSRAGFAQIELHPTDRVVRFSPVTDLSTGTPVPADHPAQLAFEAALGAVVDGAGVAAEVTGDGYHVQLGLHGDSLWFGPVAKIGEEPAGLEVPWQPGDDPGILQRPILRVLKAERLAQALEPLDSGVSFANPSPVQINAGRYPSRLAELTRPGGQINPRKECGPVYRAAMKGEFTAMDVAGDVKQCDVLRFSARGERDGQRDVNRIHIDAQYCVHVEYELIEGIDSERKLGDEMVVCSDCPGPLPYSAGHERLYFLVSDLEENAEALNLKGLVENCAAEGGDSRSFRGDALQGLLDQIRPTGLTRGNMGLAMGSARSSVWVRSFRWRVLPRPEAFRTSE